MSSGQLPLDFAGAEDPSLARDERARRDAVDPGANVALEASAGTGKTRVLVDRYVNLLLAGVDPRNILAITFTRKAAAEMRQRIVGRLRAQADEGAIAPEAWRELRDRLGEIAISTIDAFCLSLLREFPLEADVDPGFAMADETETPRLVEEALDRALTLGRARSGDREEVALVFAALGEMRLRRGLARLLDRRLVAGAALDRYLARGSRGLTVALAERTAAARLLRVFHGVPGGVEAFIRSGPLGQPRFDLLAQELRRLAACEADPETRPAPGAVSSLVTRLAEHFLTAKGEPRKRVGFTTAQFPSRAAYQAHGRLVSDLAAEVATAIAAHRRDLNVVLSHGVRWLFARALDEFRRTLDEHAVLDFSEVLDRALALLRQMGEFSQSRYRLESRYQHVLVDEFQDTSRAQWELVELLIRAWGEGFGLAAEGRLPPSVFIVGDRKQSIYGFRDADVSVLDEAARFIAALRPGGEVRRAIVRSFRARPGLLAFVNDLFGAVEKQPDRADAFRYAEQDRFPLPPEADDEPAVGVIATGDVAASARAVAGEIAALVAEGAVVRDRDTGIRRTIQPGDVAILFRSRDTHREFERQLERARLPFYVYKGLGFFDADEIKDVLALLHYLADPWSDTRAAAFLRSRFVRLSDAGLKALAPRLAGTLAAPTAPASMRLLSVEDAEALALARVATARWRALTDRVPPAELVDRALAESAYAAELRGSGLTQARENLKKVRALVRRVQNRGYATMARVAAHFAELAAGDESNAVIDAVDAVNLMTVHASKGLEFPVVFLVNLSRGTGGGSEPIRVAGALDAPDESDTVAIGEYESDIDRDAALRDREETKRLLYVATTRARDRLYLATTLTRDGRFRPGKGSLGEVLPASIAPAFEVAASLEPGETIDWEGATRRHALRVAGRAAVAPPWRAEADVVRVDDFDAIAATEAGRRRAVTADAGDVAARLPSPAARGGSDAHAGVLVHRALAAGVPFEYVADDARLKATLAALVADTDRWPADDLDSVLTRAASALRRLADDADLRALLETGRRAHEVPVSLEVHGRILRGVIDCIVEAPDGHVHVVEFKTGAPDAAHARQLARYVEAARAVFPGMPVSGRLAYL